MSYSTCKQIYIYLFTIYIIIVLYSNAVFRPQTHITMKVLLLLCLLAPAALALSEVAPPQEQAAPEVAPAEVPELPPLPTPEEGATPEGVEDLKAALAAVSKSVYLFNLECLNIFRKV